MVGNIGSKKEVWQGSVAKFYYNCQATKNCPSKARLCNYGDNNCHRRSY